MSKQALLSDRKWFERHPRAVVRFREQNIHEFSTLIRLGHTPPVFRPSFITNREEAATWVAVVDLSRLLHESSESEELSRLRVRIRIIPLNSTRQRRQARQELVNAIASELLNQELTHEVLPALQDAA